MIHPAVLADMIRQSRERTSTPQQTDAPVRTSPPTPPATQLPVGGAATKPRRSRSGRREGAPGSRTRTGGVGERRVRRHGLRTRRSRACHRLPSFAAVGVRERPHRRIIGAVMAVVLPSRWPMVGRIEVWRQLRAALNGRARVVLIHGEPGVGKTRLAGEAFAQHRQDGRAGLHVTATAAGAQIPLSGWSRS